MTWSRFLRNMTLQRSVGKLCRKQDGSLCGAVLNITRQVASLVTVHSARSTPTDLQTAPLRGTWLHARSQRDPGGKSVHTWKTTTWRWQILPCRGWGSPPGVPGIWWWLARDPLPVASDPTMQTPSQSLGHPVSNQTPPCILLPGMLPLSSSPWPVDLTLSHEWHSPYRPKCLVRASVLPPTGRVTSAWLLNLPVPQHPPL